MYIRFQTRHGTGLFYTARDLRDEFAARTIKARRRDVREIESLYHWLSTNTPVPPGIAYVDPRCRYPRTWFKAEAEIHIGVARRLAELMNLYRVGLQATTSKNPGAILWSDGVQAVVRTRDRITPRRAVRQPTTGWNGDRGSIRTYKWRDTSWKEPAWAGLADPR